MFRSASVFIRPSPPCPPSHFRQLSPGCSTADCRDIMFQHLFWIGQNHPQRMPLHSAAIVNTRTTLPTTELWCDILFMSFGICLCAFQFFLFICRLHCLHMDWHNAMTSTHMCVHHHKTYTPSFAQRRGGKTLAVQRMQWIRSSGAMLGKNMLGRIQCSQPQPNAGMFVPQLSQSSA